MYNRNQIILLVSILLPCAVFCIACTGGGGKPSHAVGRVINQQEVSLHGDPPINKLQPSLDSEAVVYFVPHADDEVLTYGVSILNDIRAKKNVYLVLMSSGSDSFSREIINGQYDEESYKYKKKGQSVYCKLHHKTHLPTEEGYHHLTRERFGEARIQEFYRAGKALGLQRDHLVVYRISNPHFKEEHLRKIMGNWIRLFPRGTFKTMSKHDIQGEHALLGKLLNDFNNAGGKEKPANVVFFESVATSLSGNAAAYLKGKERVLKLKNPRDLERLRQATEAYNQWAPKQQSFAIGYHSVKRQFEEAVGKPKTIVVNE